MNKGVQVLLHHSVGHLRLTIRLWMVGGAHPELSATQGEESFPEPADKKWISIGHDAPRHTMEFTYHLHEKLSNTLRCVLRRQHAEMKSL